jgi:hypothetical protein
MSERPSFDAQYEPGRTADGKFAPGHQFSVGRTNPANRKLNELRSLWYDASSVEDMMRVKEQLLELACTCPVPDVKLKAIVYYLDRQLGKPTERVEVDNQGSGNGNLNLNLTADQIQVLTTATQILSGKAEKPLVIEQKNSNELTT